jgi:hypothetical protein
VSRSPRRSLLAAGTVLVALLAPAGVRSLAKRPQGSNNLFVAWETLTHAGNPGGAR